MKRKTGLIVVSVLLLVLLLGCVSKGTYGQVVQERDGSNQQLQSRTAERDSAQQTLNTTLGELSSVKMGLDNAQRDLAAARLELAKVQAERDGMRSDVNAANQRTATLQAGLTRILSDLTAVKQKQDALAANFDKAQRYYNVAEAYIRLSVANITDNQLEWIQAFGQTSAAVAATGDQPLKDAWAAVTKLATTGGAQEEEIDKLDVEFMKLLSARLAGLGGSGTLR